MGDIPEDARKCMHCGEWVRERERASVAFRETPSTPGEMLSRVWHGGLTEGDVVEGVRWYVKYRIVMAMVGAVVFLIFLFAVFLPNWTKVNDNPFPGGPGDDVTCFNSHAVIGPDGVPTCAP